MNFAGILMRFLFVTFVCLSAIKTAHIPEEEGQRVHEVVMPFLDVYNRSVCRPREVLVDVLAEYPDEVEYIFIPSCVALIRCAGCCSDEAVECTPVLTHNVTLEVKRVKPFRLENKSYMSFTEHSLCECRPKKEKEKGERKQRRGRGKGLKRKRKRNRQRTQEVSSPVCEPCCSSCSERRRRQFVQDPRTCQCSCKNTEADCWAKSLELNERTCRCDKPRR
ncbi:vascular endothelial growth factor Ab isoform X1 [Alosa pseudoharengus]|uniref:vascular endothelial growth factor Ab isoform X1 n=1 Tax=Alosa sapidissima TaxID=34773 RepID=UPI001C085D28|nr:vascular endothelial growth factor Ab isoform X1 [Alosa sapidissima]